MNIKYDNMLQLFNVACPHCGDCGDLHQTNVEVWFREEDATNGIYAKVSSESVVYDNDMNNNPSSRRDGVRIKFMCYLCSNESHLDIVQHKGMTNITSK